MKRSKFTEAQIAFILRQAEEGTAKPGSGSRWPTLGQHVNVIMAIFSVAHALEHFSTRGTPPSFAVCSPASLHWLRGGTFGRHY